MSKLEFTKEDEAHYLLRLGTQMKSARLQLGWTIHELSAQVGLSATTISRLENGLNAVKLTTLKNVADKLGHDVILIPKLDFHAKLKAKIDYERSKKEPRRKRKSKPTENGLRGGGDATNSFDFDPGEE